MSSLLQQLQELALCLLVSYIIPTAICVIFAFVHHHENPFKKDNTNTRTYVFAPVANIGIALIIIFALIPMEAYWFIRKKIKKFISWKKREF